MQKLTAHRIAAHVRERRRRRARGAVRELATARASEGSRRSARPGTRRRAIARTARRRRGRGRIDQAPCPRTATDRADERQLARRRRRRWQCAGVGRARRPREPAPAARAAAIRRRHLRGSVVSSCWIGIDRVTSSPARGGVQQRQRHRFASRAPRRAATTGVMSSSVGDRRDLASGSGVPCSADDRVVETSRPGSTARAAGARFGEQLRHHVGDRAVAERHAERRARAARARAPISAASWKRSSGSTSSAFITIASSSVG